jgi:hypothetical protein
MMRIFALGLVVTDVFSGKDQVVVGFGRGSGGFCFLGGCGRSWGSGRAAEGVF